MTTTTSYGTWVNHTNGSTTSVEDDVVAALAGFAADYDVDAVVADYRNAIDAALPGGVSLCGDEFYGPYYPADQHFDGYPVTEDGRLDITAIIGAIDFWAIAERHDLTAQD